MILLFWVILLFGVMVLIYKNFVLIFRSFSLFVHVLVLRSELIFKIAYEGTILIMLYINNCFLYLSIFIFKIEYFCFG